MSAALKVTASATDVLGVLEQALAVVGGLLGGWFVAEFGGGVEGWRQRRVLRYLEIARGLGDCAEARGAEALARQETARLVMARGTTSRLWLWGTAGIVAALVTLLLGIGALVATVPSSTRAASAATAAVYGVFAVYSGIRIRRVLGVRAANKPTEPSKLVLPYAR